MTLQEQLSTIGKALDDKTVLPWWEVDDHIALLRDLHGVLLKMKPKKSCQNCRHFTLFKCSLADAVPPDSVKANGCEKFSDNIKDLMG